MDFLRNIFAKNKSLYHGAEADGKTGETKSPKDIYYYNYYNSYDAIASIVVSINKIIDMCSIVSLDLYRNEKLIESGKDFDIVKKLFKNPNKDLQMTYFELNQAIIVNYLCSGQVFIKLNTVKPDRPIITVLSSEYITVEYDSTTQNIKNIKYQLAKNTSIETYYPFVDNKTLVEYFATEEDATTRYILFTANTLAKNEVIPPLRSLQTQVDLLKEINQTNIAYAENAQNSSANVFLDNTNMSQKDLELAEKRIKESKGSKNAGKVNVYYGIKAEVMSPPENNGLATWYEKVKTKTDQEIYNFFGVPIELVMPENSSYNNKTTAKLMFLDTIKMYMNRNCNIFNQYILPLVFDSLEYEIMPNYSNIDDIENNKIARAIELLTAEIIDTNEAREMIGYNNTNAKA